MTSLSTHISPVAQNERVHLLDILRGFAILGMWTVNITLDTAWGSKFDDLSQLTFIDSFLIIVVDFFASGKFYTIFSVLFGIGFYIQWERAKVGNRNFLAYYSRRTLGLLLIAIVSFAFTLHVSILIDYAICGMVLLLFFNLHPRVILLAGIFAVIISTALVDVIPEYNEFREAEQLAMDQGITIREVLDRPSETIYNPIQKNGSFIEVSISKLRYLLFRYPTITRLESLIGVLGCLLIGLSIGKSGLVWNSDKRTKVARRAFPWLVGLGGLGCLTVISLERFGLGNESSLSNMIIVSTLQEPSRITLGLGYAAGITLLTDKKFWIGILTNFAPVGRMALTNYLLTHMLQNVITHHWGLGYFAPGPVMALLIVAVLFPLMMMFSKWWLKRFRFGPVEWAWRSLTYGKLQPLRMS